MKKADPQHQLGGTPAEVQPWPQKQCCNFFTKFFYFQNSRSCPRAFRGAGRRQKLPLDGATDFLLKSKRTLQHSVLCQLSFLCLQGSLNTPLDLSKWNLIFSFVYFKHVCWFLFIHSWSSSHKINAGKGDNSNPNSTKR